MSKKKLFLICSILMIGILVFQSISLVNYDHFEAEGGVKVDFSVDPTVVIKKYARQSLDFDYVMKDAERTHKLKGGDFFSAFAKSNKDRLQRPLIRLMNYREIDELSASSKDEEVIEFLKNKLNDGINETANYTQSRIESAFKITAEANIDADKQTMSFNFPGRRDSVKASNFTLPTINVEFFVVVSPLEFGDKWNELCELSSIDTLSEVIDEDFKLTDIDALEVPTQNLSNSVNWQNEGRGIVMDKDKDFVEHWVQSDLFDSIFAEELEVRWGEKKSEIGSGQGDFWELYIIRVPKNGIAFITEKDIDRAQVEKNEYGTNIGLRMTQEGAEKWGVMTEENVGRCVAMCVNDVVLSAPKIINPIMDGNTQISGGMNSIDFESIAFYLNSKTPDLKPILKSQTFVAANPPIFTEFIQQLLMAASVILLMFFSIMFVRNFREKGKLN